MNEFAESLEKLLAAGRVDELEASGFLDAMVPEEQGGAGLSLADAFELFVLDGKYDGGFAEEIARRGGVSVGHRHPTAAIVTAARIVGALERVLDITLAYANDRVQFGKPIAKFQAIQHQLAVMAEQVAAARMAAQIGRRGEGVLAAAVAKSRTSEAAAIVAPMAHAIHGAIGVTAEYSLQRYTKRLHEWRAAHGSETYWNRVLGGALADSDHTLTLDFVRETFQGRQP